MGEVVPDSALWGDEMNAELKAKWIEALRSGEYAQGKGALLNYDGELCCIGVFGRICGIRDALLLNHAESIADDEIPELDAIEPPDAKYPIRNLLVAMNDDGKSFPEIADWIEKNL